MINVTAYTNSASDVLSLKHEGDFTLSYNGNFESQTIALDINKTDQMFTICEAQYEHLILSSVGQLDVEDSDEEVDRELVQITVDKPTRAGRQPKLPRYLQEFCMSYPVNWWTSHSILQ